MWILQKQGKYVCTRFGGDWGHCHRNSPTKVVESFRINIESFNEIDISLVLAFFRVTIHLHSHPHSQYAVRCSIRPLGRLHQLQPGSLGAISIVRRSTIVRPTTLVRSSSGLRLCSSVLRLRIACPTGQVPPEPALRMPAQCSHRSLLGSSIVRSVLRPSSILRSSPVLRPSSILRPSPFLLGTSATLLTPIRCVH